MNFNEGRVYKPAEPLDIPIPPHEVGRFNEGRVYKPAERCTFFHFEHS